MLVFFFNLNGASFVIGLKNLPSWS